MSELETEERMTRAETATYLRELADQLEGEEAVTLEIGSRRATVRPVDPLTVKLEGESDWSADETRAKQSIEIEMVWWREARTADEGSLTVEPAEGDESQG
jgi:amphi-Trp domain-containing protein